MHLSPDLDPHVEPTSCRSVAMMASFGHRDYGLPGMEKLLLVSHMCDIRRNNTTEADYQENMDTDSTRLDVTFGSMVNTGISAPTFTAR